MAFSSNRVDRARSLVEGIVSGISFGTAAIFIRLVSLNALSILFYRLFIGGLLLLMVFRPDFDLIRKSFRYVLPLSVLLFAHFYFFIRSVQDTFILNATLIVNSAPILSIVLSMVFRLEIITIVEVFSVILSFLGIAIMSNFLFHSSSIHLIGDFEAFLAAFFISLYAIYSRRRQREGFDVHVLAGLIYLIASILGFIVATPLGLLEISLSFSDILYLVCLALIPTGIGHTLFLKALKRLKPYEAQTIALLEPITATVLGVIVFFEIPSLQQVIGAVIVFAGLVLLGYKGS